MIYGIGNDILSIKRIEELYKKYGEALPRRILSRIEILEFEQFAHQQINAVRFLAKRFAAKEALSKAVGTGFREPVSLHNISIGHNDLGKPEFLFESALQNWLAEHRIGKIHLSLSDEQDYVAAMVVAQIT
ncbi:holo-ACP synthase [Alysiella filiformis]|uniref:Holo-[acyl-carrier-protein] synthase n=1 Tax=Alysiella filiformis DSM 16848 TaxID=1120981 RepID=A0A286EFA8_9NEIS|nr:holo-ACP synthase [Alysiella filiformis]QMT30678.1 holo-ACP synthase [Alysiella filiformis]UBQ56344.1 holo-ACP synthase [Alysiella filiformis DSM 16848]SOD69606.1 holo-[acyl-carrier protein] synthase [Alysiella filiformis DSM 16848]